MTPEEQIALFPPDAVPAITRAACPRRAGFDGAMRPMRPPAVLSSPTSVEAAHSIDGAAAASLRMAVLAFVRGRGAMGATREEIERGLGISGNTVRPRVCELMDEQQEHGRKLADTGRRRKGLSGRAAAVLVAVEYAGRFEAAPDDGE